VLDACAAPGGKTAHILETEPDLAALHAVEKDAQRAKKIQQSLQRLGLPQPTLHIAEAEQSQLWWDGQAYDRILLDAPCSALGVIRRHPDIKILRQAKDINRLAKQQQKLLKALWPLLKPGGLLLYATCSITDAENKLNLAQFLSQHKDAEEDPMEALSVGAAKSPGWQILPGEAHMDGFYYARLRKLKL
jgi:16S rRNA (cytosine967-C5)-methyltransferase